MPYSPWLPENGTMRHMFRRWPELARPITEFTEVLMRGPSPFTEGERELIAAFTSATNACQFCYGIHRATAEAFGMNGALIEQLVEDIERTDIDEAMKPVLAYVKKLTVAPSRMTQADADAIFAAGWNDVAFHHAVSICGLFNYYNRILEGYGITIDRSFHQASGSALAADGYMKAVERAIKGDFDDR